MENKYEIVRSFSKTVQVRPYEPESYFCSVKEGFDEKPSDKERKEYAKRLNKEAKEYVMEDVNETIEANKPESEKVIEMDKTGWVDLGDGKGIFPPSKTTKRKYDLEDKKEAEGAIGNKNKRES